MGAIGISGGAGPQDQSVAEAGAAAFNHGTRSRPHAE